MVRTAPRTDGCGAHPAGVRPLGARAPRLAREMERSTLPPPEPAPVQSGKGGKGGKVGGKGGKGEGIVGGSLRASLPLRRWRRSHPTAISATTR